jgi:FSR family fosmidomycin resistance protein-like MFS transporter
LAALALGHFAVDLQTSGLAVLIPILHQQMGLDYGASAAIVSGQYITSSVIQPLIGLNSDRHPLSYLLPFACVVAALGTGTALFMPNYALVVAVVSIMGLASAFYHATGALNANYLSGRRRATSLSYFFAGGNFGYAVGPLAVLALLRLFGAPGTVLLIVPSAIAAVALIVFMRHYATTASWKARQSATKTSQAAIPGSLRRSAWGMLVVVLIIMVRSVVQIGLVTFIPLYYASLGPERQDEGTLLLSVFVFTGAIGTIFGGRLADKFGRKRLMIVSMGVVLPLLLLFLNSSGIVQVIAIGLAGASLISAASLTVTMAQELLPTHVGLASGLTMGLGFGIGGLGVAALGRYADVYGLPATMNLLALLPALLVLFTLVLPGEDARRQPEKIAEPAPESA